MTSVTSDSSSASSREQATIHLETSALALAMPWHVDRYSHAISLRQDGERSVALASVEGTSADVWPSSAPVQSARKELISCDESAILTVGMSGQSHWSMSIEEKLGGSLVFDVACRSSAKEPLLTSTYRSELGRLVVVSPTEAHLVSTAGDVLLRLETTSAGIAPPPALAMVGDLLTITAAISLPENPRGRTLRWKYAIFPGKNDANKATDCS